jgi:4'-phosphopantetheinyl transferase
MVWSPPPHPVLLDEGDVHLWRAPLDLAGPELDELRRTLSPDELARAARFRFPEAQNRFAAARGSLRTILALYCHADPGSLQFGYRPAGKPYLASGQGPEFSVSHSHSRALYGIARGREIGVDLERIGKPSLDHERIAGRFFSPAEAAYLMSLPPETRVETFFRIWTLKEAYVKALGEGLRIPLASFEVSIAPGRPEASLRSASRDPGRESWFLASVDPGFGYAAAVALPGSAPRLSFWDLRSPPGGEEE